MVKAHILFVTHPVILELAEQAVTEIFQKKEENAQGYLRSTALLREKGNKRRKKLNSECLRLYMFQSIVSIALTWCLVPAQAIWGFVVVWGGMCNSI